MTGACFDHKLWRGRVVSPFNHNLITATLLPAPVIMWPMSRNYQQHEKCDMSAPQAQIVRPLFPTHAEQAMPDQPAKPFPWWVRALVKVGAMADTDNNFPRINPAVLSLLALILTASLGLGAAVWYIGRQSATIESLGNDVSELKRLRLEDAKAIQQQRLDDAKYLEAVLSEMKTDLGLNNPKRGKK